MERRRPAAPGASAGHVEPDSLGPAGRRDAAPPILRIGDAFALVIDGTGPDRATRTAQAEAALLGALGREVRISRRPSGRPRLDPPEPELGVSLSLRGERMLVGFNPAGAVGADLEADDASVDAARLARDHFSAAEAARVAAAPEAAAARDLFFRLWVAKEAALKVTGRGVYDGIDEPGLAGVVEGLRRDGAVVTAPAGARVPALRIAVCRLAGLPVCYAALAISA